MTSFRDGPAAGVHLMLQRAPLYLRAVTAAEGQWDALDLLDDEPAADESIVAYRRVGAASACMLDWTEKGRRRGGRFAMAAYEWVAEQPEDATMRDRTTWRLWCTDQQLAAARARI